MVTFPSLVARGGGVTLPPFSTKEGGRWSPSPSVYSQGGGEVVTLPPLNFIWTKLEELSKMLSWPISEGDHMIIQ